MPTTCAIEFDNPSKVYYSGQNFNGRIVLRLTKEITVRGIFIRITGKAHCEWSEGSGNNERKHRGEQIYLDQRTYFLGGDTGELTVKPGVYTFPFQCSLPSDLPTSLEARYGYIRYEACLKIDRPIWPLPDETFESRFTVIKPLNLNAHLNMREPISGEEEYTLNAFCCFFCWQTKPMVISAHLPVSGYTPGQSIRVQYAVNNNSGHEIQGFSTQLIKQITYYTKPNGAQQYVEKIIITEFKSDGCPSSDPVSRTNCLFIPSIPPTDISTNSICKVEYYVRILGRVGACHSNPKLDIPVIIGTYPILDDLSLNTTALQNSIPSDKLPDIRSTIKRQAEECDSELEVILKGRGETIPLHKINTLPNEATNLTSENGVDHVESRNSLSVCQQPTSSRKSDLEIILAGLDQEIAEKLIESAAALPYPEKDPPTYEESALVVNEQENIKRVNFKPKYPMYRRETSYSSIN